MSMYAYVGLPRSGKSYNVVANVIVPALRDGRKVVSNVPIYLDKVRAKLVSEGVSEEKIGTFVEFPVNEVAQDPEKIGNYVVPGCVFVLDEVWRLWPAGEKAVKVPEVYKSIIAEHGHRVDEAGNAIHIVLVVQDLGNIGMFARRLVEQTFIHTKLGHVGTPNRFRVDIYHGHITGITGPKDKRIREMFGKYDASVWALYKSHTMSEAKTDGANEKAIDTRGNVLKGPLFVVGIPAMIVVACGAAWYLKGHMLGVEKVAPSATKQSAPLSVAAAPQTVRLVEPPRAVLPAPQPPPYRLVGVVQNLDKPEMGFAVLELGKRLYRRDLSHCRLVDKDFTECEIVGHYYGIGGLSPYESDAAPAVEAVPLSRVAANQPLSPEAPVGASVASDVGEPHVDGAVSAEPAPGQALRRRSL